MGRDPLTSADDRAVRTIEDHTRLVASVAYSPDGRWMASGSWDGSVHIREVASGAIVLRLCGHTRTVREVAFHPDGRYLASGGWDNCVRIWDTHTGDEIRTLDNGKLVSGLAFSPDGRRLAVTGHDIFKIWDWQAGKVVLEPGPVPMVLRVRFSPDGRYLATANAPDLEAALWDAETGKMIRHFQGHEVRVYDVVFSPDGRRLATGSIDKTVRVWDAATGSPCGSSTSARTGSSRSPTVRTAATWPPAMRTASCWFGMRRHSRWSTPSAGTRATPGASCSPPTASTSPRPVGTTAGARSSSGTWPCWSEQAGRTRRSPTSTEGCLPWRQAAKPNQSCLACLNTETEQGGR